MEYYVLTLFPEMIQQGMETSITGRAMERRLLSLHTVNIRDYTKEKHGKVDDYPYGGGAGMVMQAEPVYQAFSSLPKPAGTKARRVVYLTPQGRVFQQKLAMELSREEELVFLCGHYEGIDERVLEEIVTDYVSIGDYVLTGGELPAMVMMDAISRLIPGVLNNQESACTETFDRDLLEYPQYSRPEAWRGKRVPKVLLSGDHKAISQWRLDRSIERTRAVRPDYYRLYEAKQRAVSRLSRKKRLHLPLMEALRQGRAELLYEGAEGSFLMFTNPSHTYMITAQDETQGAALLDQLKFPYPPKRLMSCQEWLNEGLMERFGFTKCRSCYQADYSKQVKLSERTRDFAIRPLDMKELYPALELYPEAEENDIRDGIQRGRLYGAYGMCGELLGIAGFHSEGNMGYLMVKREHRRKGIGGALERFLINRSLERRETPYIWFLEENEGILPLQQRLGLNLCRDRVFWLSNTV